MTRVSIFLEKCQSHAHRSRIPIPILVGISVELFQSSLQPHVGIAVLPNGESPTGLDSEKTEELCAKVCELTGQRHIS